MPDNSKARLIALAALAAGTIALSVVAMHDRDPGASADSGAPAISGATTPAPLPGETALPAGSAAPSALPRARGSSASAFMPELRRAADAGDPAAACRLAIELHGCIEVQHMEVAAMTGDGLRDSPDQPLATVAAHHARCSAATDAELEDRYRYQAQVFGSGNPVAERWFIQAPLLGDDEFLANSPNAVDFRRRAQAYVARAIQRKEVEDLKLLLEVYRPREHSMARLRIRDDAMFLALADAAVQAGAIEEADRALADQVRRKAGADVLAQVVQRAAQVGTGWRKVPATAGPDDPSALSDPCAALKRT